MEVPLVPYKFTGGMCFFPDSLQLLYFPLKDSRSLLLLCFQYHQLASLDTCIFPISDTSYRVADKRHIKFPVYSCKLVLLITSPSSDFTYELQRYQLNLTVFLELSGQLNTFLITKEKENPTFSIIKHIFSD